jgi:predicted ATPase
MTPEGRQPPVITRLTVRNYRVLRDVTLTELTPFTVLVGPNGSGKSTVLDVFAFLSQAIEDGADAAAAARGGVRELRTLGAEGPIQLEVDVRHPDTGEEFGYHLTLVDLAGAASAAHELVERISPGRKVLLEFHSGAGVVFDSSDGYNREVIEGDSLALDTFGRLSRFGELAWLRRFILAWVSVNVEVAKVRAGSRAGVHPSKRMPDFAADGSDTARELDRIADTGFYGDLVGRLRRYVPQLESVRAVRSEEGELLIRLKDRTFEKTASSDAASEGTLKLLAQLLALRQQRASVLMVEEPENNLHPKMHYRLAEDFRLTSADRQLLVATHSPKFVDAVRPEELWALQRGPDGYAVVQRAGELPVLTRMLASGGALGDLWSEGFFQAGDPPEDFR